LQTGEQKGYYQDFGSLSDLNTAIQQGYVYTGQYSAFRQRRHGAPPTDLRRSQFVVFSQNHDQVGNRGLGERISKLISFEAQKLSAAVVLLSPNLPLLFMGEEYGETAPFLYFTDHSDPALGQAVRAGRQAEFSSFHAIGTVPDPQSASTFLKSKLNKSLREQGHHKVLRNLYQALLHVRRTHGSFADLDAAATEVAVFQECLVVHRSYATHQLWMVFHFGEEVASISACPSGQWRKLLDSAESKWMGPGSDIPDNVRSDSVSQLPMQPKSFCIFESVDPVHSSSSPEKTR
jgi:maltooligosyltrehalose trehalohydrolase